MEVCFASVVAPNLVLAIVGLKMFVSCECFLAHCGPRHVTCHVVVAFPPRSRQSVRSVFLPSRFQWEPDTVREKECGTVVTASG